MKLSKLAIYAIKGAGPSMKAKIAEALGITSNAVYRMINDNDINGSLTKAAALKVISEETGLDEEKILETEPEIQK